MTAAMPGYGADLPDELVLGHIAWYTVTQPQVTQPELADIVTTLGLSPTIIPKEPRPGDAFKRACRYSERNGLPLPLSEDTGNFLIRPVSQNSSEVERHLVLERVDSLGKVLDYTTTAKLTFDRGDNQLHVSKRGMPDHLDALVVETLNLFHDNFEFALEHIDAQVIRRMIREQLTLMGAIAVRRQGSIYFAPIKEKTRTLALESLCTQIGGGSVFHSIPLPDTSKQREMIHQAFQEEVHEEATQLITELRKIHANTESVLTSKAWIEYQKRLKQLQSNFTVYGDMVGMEMTKAETELEAVNKQLKNLMIEGRVKSK